MPTESRLEQKRKALRKFRASAKGQLAAKNRIKTPQERQANLDYSRLVKYGLTPEQFSALLDKQHGLCAICRRPEPGGRGTWHIDHDHTCCPGRVVCGGTCIRGLLCYKCNVALGFFNDDPQLLLWAISYLRSRYAD